MADTLTTKQALEIALSMHKEKASFDEIAQHLEQNGYRSERTRKPVKAQMIRYMVNKAQGKVSPSRMPAGQRASAGARKKTSGRMEVAVGYKGQLLQAAKEILEMESTDQDIRLNLLEALIQQRHRKPSEATAPV